LQTHWLGKPAMIEPLHVVNPRGRDSFCDYRQGVGTPGDSTHAPVNYHGYAAASNGVFTPDWKLLPEQGHVLLLLRRRLPVALRALRSMKKRGRLVLLTWKETAPHQVALQMRRWGNKRKLAALLREADGVMAPSRWAAQYFEDVMAEMGLRRPVFEVPTPYPLEQAGWDDARPLGERAGIIVGTREWQVPSRRHEDAIATALQLARPTGTHVTVIHTGNATQRERLLAMADSHSQPIRIVDRLLAYPEWLSLLAEHRLVLQCDASRTPGQVAGDCLLAGLPCAGGNGMIERLVFGRLGNDDGQPNHALSFDLLGNDNDWQRIMAEAKQLAHAKVSHSAFRQRWTDIVRELQNRSQP